MSLRSYVRELLDPTAPLYVGVRHRHDERECSSGKDRCLVVTRTPTGWDFFCHRCGTGGTFGLDGLSVRETLALVRSRQRQRPDETARVVRLPSDFSKAIPSAGLAWLLKYGVTPEEIQMFGIGYSKREGRVILPVYSNNELVYWQGRYIGDHKRDEVAKYRNQKAMGRNDLYFRNITAHTTDIVLVEDIISAIKVGRVTSCIALLYATIPLDLIKQLASTYDTVWIWLDPDKAAYTARMLMRCRSLGYPVRRIYTDKDPKYYTEEEIEDHLG